MAIRCVGVIFSASLLMLLSSMALAEEKMSADKAAKELANPNTALASLKFKLQYRQFKGDLPGADDESGTTVLFQPSLPFPLANKDKILFRPAIPIITDQPVFDGVDFESESGIGDISFDLAYAPTRDDGLLIAYGIISSLPTATEDTLGSDRVTLGPEFLIGKITKTYIIGAFPNHQWDIGGSGDADINITSSQFFGILLPGDGWSYGTAPTVSYDWEIEEWTAPLNFTISKTIIMGGRPWKIGGDIDYYVEQPDAFGPDIMFTFSVTPVVENVLVNWFK